MTDQNWMQDNHDVWNNSMDLAGITNGGIVGFKYFGFGGLQQDTKGVKAFEGAKKGDGTRLDLFLTPGGRGAFKIHVMLDGPYANDTWKGREIAVIDVPADAPRAVTNYRVAVPAVEGLSGKHAIYLVVEGPEIELPQMPRFGGNVRPQTPQRPIGLFDLHGIGFSKGSVPCEKPVVPNVMITADGKALAIPDTPIRCSNANGLTDQIRYQVYGPIGKDTKLEVAASDPGVKVEVSPVVEGRATVTCTYNGLKKIYLIN
jgi:hypothetical protein